MYKVYEGYQVEGIQAALDTINANDERIVFVDRMSDYVIVILTETPDVPA